MFSFYCMPLYYTASYYCFIPYPCYALFLLIPPCSSQSITAFRLYLVGYVKTGWGKLYSLRSLQMAVFFLPSNSNTSFSSIKSVEVISTSFKITVKNTCPTPTTSPFSTNITAVDFFTRLFDFLRYYLYLLLGGCEYGGAAGVPANCI